MPFYAKNKSNIINDNDFFLKIQSSLDQCDPDTMQHCLRVGSYAKIVMEEYLTKYPLEVEYTPKILQWAATLHDIGKSKIPLKILMKSTPLSTEEMLLMKKHSAFGEQILSQIMDSRSKVIERCAHDVILYHHERYDGKGYPNGLQGTEIPLSAQMVSLADCFDALVSTRSYKPSFDPQIAYSMIINGECGAFSNEILSCLSALMPK